MIRRAWKFLLSTLLAGTVAVPSPAMAVPQAWTDYAQIVRAQIEEWFAGDDEAAIRFHTYLEQRLLEPSGKLPPTVIMKVWIAEDGSLQRLRFRNPLQDTAEQDAQTAILHRKFLEAPPKGMTQPIVLKIDLKWRG